MDKEELAQLREVAKVMAMPGWDIILASVAHERERQLKKLMTAKVEGHFQFLRGQLAGFDSLVHVFDVLKRSIDDEANKGSDGGNE